MSLRGRRAGYGVAALGAWQCRRTGCSPPLLAARLLTPCNLLSLLLPGVLPGLIFEAFLCFCRRSCRFWGLCSQGLASFLAWFPSTALNLLTNCCWICQQAQVVDLLLIFYKFCERRCVLESSCRCFHHRHPALCWSWRCEAAQLL